MIKRIDTDVYKSQSEIAEMYGVTKMAISKAIRQAEKVGKKVTKETFSAATLYDIRTLPVIENKTI